MAVRGFVGLDKLAACGPLCLELALDDALRIGQVYYGAEGTFAARLF